MTIELIKKSRTWTGTVSYYRHQSEMTSTPMQFSIFIPDGGSSRKKTLLWLSGLTCTEENFITKSGALGKACELDMIIVCPDTSPRGTTLKGEHDSYDFGSGAGFYVDATQSPWNAHYLMHSYLRDEFVPMIGNHFPINTDAMGISGHSMGGLGALMFGISYPETFKSLSAFAPIVSPIHCPWGHKAFTNYLGENNSNWEQYDPCYLLKERGYNGEILIDQGDSDEFLQEQLKPELLEKIGKDKNIELKIRYQQGYDHSYFFISSFIGEHLEFHHTKLI